MAQAPMMSEYSSSYIAFEFCSLRFELCSRFRDVCITTQSEVVASHKVKTDRRPFILALTSWHTTLNFAPGIRNSEPDTECYKLTNNIELILISEERAGTRISVLVASGANRGMCQRTRPRGTEGTK